MAGAKRGSLADNMKSMDERVSPEIKGTLDKSAGSQPAASKPASRVASTRVGKKHLLVPIDPPVHKRLKLLAVEKEVTIESLVRGAIDKLLAG